ncbi:dipeptidase [Silvibacterium acidisoli]|uniref:dipeptidase n=1 Tax=Acidobacteriaceae bacterium ZG23-2 TaxID=2883246 RepID=UPI00406CBCD3
MEPNPQTPPIDIFDGHNDVVQLLREYAPEGVDFLAENTSGHLDLPRARRGRLIGGFFAMWVPSQTTGVPPVRAGHRLRLPGAVDYPFAKAAIERQLAALRALAERAPEQVRIVVTPAEIEQARSEGIFSILLHMEGAEAIGPGFAELDELYAKGLRSLGIVWSRPNIFGNGVPFAYPSSPDTGPGLTDMGKELVRRCNQLGVLIDLAHLNERGFWDVARLTTAPLVATHSCSHVVCASSRNLTDEQLDAIRESDGLVGLNFSVGDVRADGMPDAETPLHLLARQCAYLVEKLGIDRVAIGSDFDGATIPAEIGSAAGLQNLIEALREHGFDDASLRKIGFENWMRVLRLTQR